jgi:hypothetical protein
MENLKSRMSPAATLAAVALMVGGPFVLHLKVVDGEPVPSGTPSCVTCSRSMLELRVGWVWLWTSEGWKVWTATEFHHATLANLGLPALRGEGL